MRCQACDGFVSVIPAKERHPVLDTGQESRITLYKRVIWLRKHLDSSR